MIINGDIFDTVVTAITTIAVGILTAWVAMYTVKKQIKNEQKKLADAVTKQEEFTKKAIENFIGHEIKDNLKILDKNGELRRYIYSGNRVPVDYKLERKLKFDEYNKLKYELVKYESEEIEGIIRIYDMFYMLARVEEVGSLTTDEYIQFKATFDECVTIYG